jgi:alpha-L-fucosidase
MKRAEARTMMTALIVVIYISRLAWGCDKKPPENYLLESPADKAARMSWWKEARFGMFIHWGLYAVPAGGYHGQKVPSLGEWIMNNASIPIAEYEKLAPMFNPREFDADQWVRIAKQAGMKYIIITSKHHDGFGLWDSKVTSWDVVDSTPFRRDILRELSDACKRANMPLGFYYSIMDWHHPKAQGAFFPNYNDLKRKNPLFSQYAENYMKPQLKELLGGYDIEVLWFDGQWIADWSGNKGRELYNFVRNLKPDILVNNRVGRDVQAPNTCQAPTLIGDFITPEQQIPKDGLPGMDWEACITMNNTWGYKFFDQNWKSGTLLIRILVDIASKGGNLLLNVGPTAEGIIPEASVERLKEMGQWLTVNGESIYGAKASPFGEARWGRYTTKGNKLYAHVMTWPKDGKLRVARPAEPISTIYLLADKKKTPLKYSRKDEEIIVDVPVDTPDSAAAVVVIEIR